MISRKHQKLDTKARAIRWTKNFHFSSSNHARRKSNINMTEEQETPWKEEPTDLSVGRFITHTTGKPWQSQPNLLST